MRDFELLLGAALTDVCDVHVAGNEPLAAESTAPQRRRPLPTSSVDRWH